MEAARLWSRLKGSKTSSLVWLEPRCKHYLQYTSASKTTICQTSIVGPIAWWSLLPLPSQKSSNICSQTLISHSMSHSEPQLNTHTHLKNPSQSWPIVSWFFPQCGQTVLYRKWIVKSRHEYEQCSLINWVWEGNFANAQTILLWPKNTTFFFPAKR